MGNQEEAEFEEENEEENKNEDQPSRVKSIQKSEIEKLYKNLGCERVWNLCKFESVEDNLGHLYYKATGICRFKVFNDIKTECQVKLKYEDINENEKEWKNIISIENFPHTHPSPILNAEEFKNWQKAKDPKSKKNNESKSSNSTPATSKDQKKISPILTKSPMKSKIEDKIVKPPKKSSANRRKNIRKIQEDESSDFEEELLKLDEKVGKSNEMKNLATKVRIMTNEQRNECYEKFGLNKERLGTILIDNTGHIYGLNGATLICKFAYWKTYNRSCRAHIYVNGDVIKEWRDIKHSTHIHNHQSPYEDPRDIQGSHYGKSENMTSSTFDSFTDDQTSSTNQNRACGKSNNSIEKYLVRTEISESRLEKCEEIGRKSAKKRRIENENEEDLNQRNISSEKNFGKNKCTELRNSSTPSEEIVRENSSSQIGNESSTSAPENQRFLPAWTNCETCKACVLINPKSTTKNLIAIAKTHINQFHGINFYEINKKIIKLHLPNILNLKEIEQIRVSESLLLNDCGDYLCEIPGCNTKMVNMIDETENDNDLINHVILEHLAPDETINNEIFWQCFPTSAPKTQFQNTGNNGNLAKQE